jgi:hypothetical protein
LCYPLIYAYVFQSVFFLWVFWHHLQLLLQTSGINLPDYTVSQPRKSQYKLNWWTLEAWMGNTNDLQKSFGGILVITCNTTICNLQSFGQTGYGATCYDHYVVIFMPLKYIKLKLQL